MNDPDQGQTVWKTAQGQISRGQTSLNIVAIDPDLDLPINQIVA